MFKSYFQTEAYYNKNLNTYLNFNKPLHSLFRNNYREQNARPIIIQETYQQTNNKFNKQNLPFNYDNVINSYKK
jgi:U3 small nucleolar RNA-associated protein 14